MGPPLVVGLPEGVELGLEGGEVARPGLPAQQSFRELADLQLSCLHLGFYLASWGMYRGSTALLQQSVKRLTPVIAAIAAAPQEIWSVDADDYSGATADLVFEVGRRLRVALPPGSTDTLVTKIMLGVFGCVPALDANFVEGLDAQGMGAHRSVLRLFGALCASTTQTLQPSTVAECQPSTSIPANPRTVSIAVPR